jgi:coenzyme F420-dependent glucose-6-phosphate dehydrogenase
MLTLGYKASAGQPAPRELRGYPWRDTGGHAPFSVACLGPAAARTVRIRIGTSVVTASFRHHPVVTRALATVGRA